MTYKQQICNRIIEKMEWWREAKWADYIDLHTKDAVITVMENVVDGIANMRQSRYEKDADRWIPCSERLPNKADHTGDMVLVCYRNGSVRFNTYMNGWVQGNPVAWMPLPEPYKEVNEWIKT